MLGTPMLIFWLFLTIGTLLLHCWYSLGRPATIGTPMVIFAVLTVVWLFLTVFALQILFFCFKHTVPVITDTTDLFLYHLGTWSCLPKNFRTKISTGLGYFGTPYIFLQPLKLATSNLVQRGFGECVTITALVSNLVGAGWSKIVGNITFCNFCTFRCVIRR